MADLVPPIGSLVEAFWANRQPFGTLATPAPGAWAFGGTAAQADALVRLVNAGAKSATSSALWCYESEGEALPLVGELSIVCDGSGRPHIVLRTTQVDVVPFEEVPASHASAEGEGDRSLEHWRREHEAFFRAQLPRGREFTRSMPVVLERFELE